MKTIYSRLFGIIVLLSLGACVAPQMLAVPAITPPASHSVGTHPLVEKNFNHMLRALDDKNSILYLQSFGGGGVGLGLLGPFGVAANISMIEKNTDADVALLKGKIPLDPQAIFSEISGEYPTLTSGATLHKSVRITPLIDVIRQENEQLLFGCSILVDYTPIGTNWVGKYVYQFSLEYSKNDIAQGLSPDQHRALSDQAKTGFRMLANLYLDDMSGKLPSRRDLKFKSTFISPRFGIEMAGQEVSNDGERITIRSVGAVYSFPKSLVHVSN